jgi:cytochrome c oxidase subunit 3
MRRPIPDRNYLIHPSSIMMVLILAGVSALFGALSFAYLYTRIDKGMESITIPWLFILNTFILASSSLFIQLCRKYYDQKNEKLILRYGWLTIITTLLFLVSQSVAWYQLLDSQIKPGSSGGHGFLYAISILHFFHVSAGLPFLLRILYPLRVAQREGSSALLFLTDDMHRKLKHTAWYWHFIDLMWIYLMLFFIINTFV